MITFKQFLNESRVAKASVDDVINWLDKNAKGYMSGFHFLYRGGSGSGEDVFYMGDSLKGASRKSANTNNNYTLWMDNSPMFKGWPKRSRSFICSSSYDDAEGFGVVHIVIPADSNKVGEVGEDDLWMVEILPRVHVEDWNEDMEWLLGLVGREQNDSYEELHSALSFATVARINEAVTQVDSHDKKRVDEWLDRMRKGNCSSLLEMWEKYFKPKLFTKTTGAGVSETDAGGEVWVEGPCAFIPFEKPADEDAEKFMEWASEKHPPLGHFLKGAWG